MAASSYSVAAALLSSNNNSYLTLLPSFLIVVTIYSFTLVLHGITFCIFTFDIILMSRIASYYREISIL